MHRKVKTALTISTLACALAAAPTTASAQSTPPAPSASSEVQNYSQQDLERFVAAATKVSLLSQEYAPRIHATESEPERAAIVKEADEKMIRAVNDEGLSVEKFLTINQAAQTDRSLQQQLSELAK